MKAKLIFLAFFALVMGCSSGSKKDDRSSEGGNSQSEQDPYGENDQPGSVDDAIAKQSAKDEAAFRASTGSPTPEMYRKFNQARLAHQAAQAQDAAGDILTRSPNDTTVLNGLAVMNIEMGKIDTAKFYLSRALLKSPNESALHNNAGVVELKSKNLRQALTSFKRAIELNPSNRAAHANLGSVYLQYQNHLAARDELAQAVRLGDTRAEVLSNYGVALRYSGDPERAVEMFEKAAEKDGRNQNILLNYAACLVEAANRPKRGLKIINKIRMVATDPGILEKARNLAKVAEGASQNSQEKESPGEAGI